jgi:Uma2 family endonuclease
MVAQRLPQRMSVDEWRALERGSAEIRHEYIDGYVYAMAGGTLANNRIASNAVRILEDALGDGLCSAFSEEVATRIAENRYTYPDVVVTCEGSGVASRSITEIGAPRIVFEALSESTERYDRSLKAAYYRECPTLEEYVLVSTEYQAVEVYRRASTGWGMFQVYGPGDEIELTSIGVRFSLAALYRRTDVPERPTP